MKLLPLDKLGAREVSSGVVEFGVFFPGITPGDGNRLWVRIIHEKDQFLQAVPALDFELAHTPDPEYGDYWSARVDVNQRPATYPSHHWGTPGQYVYHFYLENSTIPRTIDWIIDPFAREFGIGKLSAFTVGAGDYAWSTQESTWKIPPLHDLVFYELMITEFGGDIQGTIQRLDYLADMGVNCLEIMPVSNVTYTIDWGYLPVGYFGIDERFGKRRDFQRLVDEAHQRGIAVVIDSIYGHTSEDFPYAYVYDQLGVDDNPFLGPFARDMYGRSTSFNKTFTQDFFYTLNYFWLDRFHVDGFRYDCVPNYWDGPTGKGFASLVYNTYHAVDEHRGVPGHWQRFFGDDGTIHLIQCAEQLEGPEEIVWETYANCTWQNQTLDAAKGIKLRGPDGVTEFGLRLGLVGYPAETVTNGDRLAKSALQYIETHDHGRFICHFRTLSHYEELLWEGDRSLWYKVQPYLIGLFTGKGIPMLWQGQELCENYFIPNDGYGRVRLLRPVRWHYFHDSAGSQTLALVRKLGRLRRERVQFRSGDHHFYNDFDHYQSRNVLLFHRQQDQAFSLVALNFGDSDQVVPFWFPTGGRYREELHGEDNLQAVVAGEERSLTVPANYGRIWTLETGGG